MDNTYYVNDGYFTNILKNYFNNKNWNRVLKKNSRNCTFNHTNFEKKCTDCTYTNRFKSLRALDHKGNLYNKMRDKSYITNYFVFNSVNGLNKYKNLFDNKKYWLIKPELGMRQEGIAISNKYSDIINHIRKYKKDRKWVCMEYIANPLLYDGKKTHFRVYVLIIKREEGFECYLYKKGYMYIADEKYKLKDFTNPNIHITSSCNNQEFPKKFNEIYGNNSFEKVVYPQFKVIVNETIHKFYKELECTNNQVDNYTCYKHLGYDIILDTNLKAYLLEINGGTVGMASHDLRGNCKSKTPSLQKPKFKKKYMYDTLDCILEKKSKIGSNFDLLFKTKNKIIEHFETARFSKPFYYYFIIIIFLIVFVILLIN